MRNASRLTRPRAIGIALLLALAGAVIATASVSIPALALTISVSDSGGAVRDTAATTGWERGSKDVVRMGQDIEVGPADTIEGDVVSIGGRITIAGKVKGDAVSIGGGVHLLPGSVVNGDVVTVGGKLDREPGATVLGQNVSVGPSLGWVPFVRHGRVHHGSTIGRIVKDVARYVVFFLIGLIIFLAFPRRMSVVRETIRTRFWLSLVVGFGALAGLVAAIILLMITCIGIVVAIPGAFLSMLAIIATAMVAVSLLGEAILHRPVAAQGDWVSTMLVGLLILFGVQVVGRILTGSEGFLYGLGRTILVIDSAAWAVLVMVGFGSLVLSKLGSRTMPPQPWPATVGMTSVPGAPPPGAGTPPTATQPPSVG